MRHCAFIHQYLKLNGWCVLSTPCNVLNTSHGDSQAVEEDVIPLSEPVTTKDGEVLDSLNIRKGDGIIIPIYAIHRSKMIWGEDAEEWKPERWFNPLP